MNSVTAPILESDASAAAGDGAALRIAYVMSRFPKLTETFILYEMQALAQCGLEVEVFPLLPAGSGAVRHIEGASLAAKARELLRKSSGDFVMHPEARPYVDRAHYGSLLSWDTVKAQWHYLRRRPRAYLAALATLVRANWGSRRLLLGGVALFPRMVLLARTMQIHGVDHVHAHFATHPAAAAFIVRRLTGISYSFTAHGSDLHVDRHMLREKTWEAASVITISNYNKEVIVAHCGEDVRDRIDVFRCGVDTQLFQAAESYQNSDCGVESLRCSHENESWNEPTPGSDSRVNGRPLRLVCIGTFYEVKGHTYLIEACRLLRGRGVNLVCHLVGDGPDRERLARQAAEAGLADVVRFHGRLTRDEVAALLKEADLLAAPSVQTQDGRREGIPVVLMEAMACGVPVVASRISGIPELVIDEETGLLAPERDAAALADAVERLARDPALRKRLGAAGAAKVRREFDLHKNARALARHFQKIARRCG